MKLLRVLVAEDEALIRVDIKEMLEEEGHEVVAEAASGDAAIELARAVSPDLALLDIKMPGLDGLKVADMIRCEKIAPVVILSAYSQRSFLNKAREARVSAYLVKPFKKEDLLSAVEIAKARFDEFVGMEAERDGLRATLETRKLLDRAKGVLMDKYGFSEKKAFTSLQKLAMDRQAPLKEICELVISSSLKAQG